MEAGNVREGVWRLSFQDCGSELVLGIDWERLTMKNAVKINSQYVQKIWT